MGRMLYILKTRCIIALWLAIVGALSIGSAPAQDRSSLTDEVHIFAASHLESLQDISFAKKKEYCGLIGYDHSGQLAATKAKRGGRDGCRPKDEPDGFRVVDSYHTHGGASLDSDTEAPSIDDLEADIEEGVNGYIATPGGRLWFNDAAAGQATMLCGPGCLKADPKFEACPAFLPKGTYDLDGLIERAENDTGEC